MNKIIQIRGSNAVGKTTTVRKFIENKNMHIEQIMVSNIKTDITCDANKQYIVLGRYDVKNGGCDRFKNRTHVINTILYLVKTYKPKVIIFEGFIYGKTFKFALDIEKLARMFSYKYIPIVLYRSPENALKLLYDRNGKSRINEQTFYECYKSSLTSYEKIKRVGIGIQKVNTDDIPIDDMHKIIERFI